MLYPLSPPLLEMLILAIIEKEDSGFLKTGMWRSMTSSFRAGTENITGLPRQGCCSMECCGRNGSGIRALLK